MKDNRIAMMGSICGDIIGSAYEFRPTKRYDFPLFTRKSTYTDDTVMTCAVADWLMTDVALEEKMQDWGRVHLDAGYGPMFYRWIIADFPRPYNSFGNGSAMRVSPVVWFATSLEECLRLAKVSAEVTHNHPEGIKGAQATASAVYLARTGGTKEEIKKYITDTFGYNLERKYSDIKPNYKFDVTCQGSVPESIICFLESTNYESAIRLAVSMGGDADTMGAITGGIAAAFYKEIPDKIAGTCLDLLPDDIYEIVTKFSAILNKWEVESVTTPKKGLQI